MIFAYAFYSVAAPSGPDLYDYGFAGIIIGLLATGIFRYKGEVANITSQYLREIADLRADLKEQRDLNRQQNDIIKAFQNQLTVHTIPAMERNVQVLEAIPDKETAIIQELEVARQEMRDLMQKLESFPGNGS